eukprot:2898225-Alexandrium_andersonii.AAC.1
MKTGASKQSPELARLGRQPCTHERPLRPGWLSDSTVRVGAGQGGAINLCELADVRQDLAFVLALGKHVQPVFWQLNL